MKKLHLATALRSVDTIVRRAQLPDKKGVRVKTLILFGSVARGEPRPSDIDIAAELEPPANMDDNEWYEWATGGWTRAHQRLRKGMLGVRFQEISAFCRLMKTKPAPYRVYIGGEDEIANQIAQATPVVGPPVEKPEQEADTESLQRWRTEHVLRRRKSKKRST